MRKVNITIILELNGCSILNFNSIFVSTVKEYCNLYSYCFFIHNPSHKTSFSYFLLIIVFKQENYPATTKAGLESYPGSYHPLPSIPPVD